MHIPPRGVKQLGGSIDEGREDSGETTCSSMRLIESLLYRRPSQDQYFAGRRASEFTFNSQSELVFLSDFGVLIE